MRIVCTYCEEMPCVCSTRNEIIGFVESCPTGRTQRKSVSFWMEVFRTGAACIVVIVLLIKC